MNPKRILLTLFFVSILYLANACDPNPESNIPNRKYDINGSVIVGQSKKPLNNVSVTAFLNSKKEKVMATDNNGNYFFDDLKPGTYKFVFEKDGFKKVTKDRVVIKTDDAFLLNVEMLEDADFEFLPGVLHFLMQK